MAQPIVPKKPILPLGGWGNSEEALLAEWADKAACYRWLHDRTEKKFRSYNMALTIPVIILSTLTGTANFGMTSIFPQSLQSIAQLGIGGVSLITGMITTIANFLQYAQGMEAHRSAGISWGKLQRKISVELALPRGQREDCMDFLLVARSELDRMIESSPSIPADIIATFEYTFRTVTISRPEVCNNLEKTKIYDSKHENLADITSKAAIMMKENLASKRVGALRRITEPKVRERILQEVNSKRAGFSQFDTTAVIRQDLEALAHSGVVTRMKNKNVQIITPKQPLDILRPSPPSDEPVITSEEVKLEIPEQIVIKVAPEIKEEIKEEIKAEVPPEEVKIEIPEPEKVI